MCNEERLKVLEETVVKLKQAAEIYERRIRDMEMELAKRELDSFFTKLEKKEDFVDGYA